jgi:hypothetical protein
MIPEVELPQLKLTVQIMMEQPCLMKSTPALLLVNL